MGKIPLLLGLATTYAIVNRESSGVRKATKKLTKIVDVIFEADVTDEEKDNRVRVVNDSGSDMMCMKEVGVEGDNMTVVGSLMGAWESTMYVAPEDVVKMIKLMMKPAAMGYMVKLPFTLYKLRKENAEYGGE